MADRVERLTNLLALLLETSQPLSLVELAGELTGQYPESQTARRAAFERDKAALREIGVPIEQEIVGGGAFAGQTRYWIDRERYEMRGLDLDSDETRALQVAMAATRPGSASGQDALWKLGAGVLDQGATVAAIVPDVAELPTLREAVSSRRSVTFDYNDVHRTVDPWGLLLRDGYWYMIGFDHGRDERRTYRIDRIAGHVVIVEGGETFERPADFDPRHAFPDDPKMIGADASVPDARVVIDAPRAALAVRELGESRVVVTRDDGSVEVMVPCANLSAFRSWLLGFVEFAEVLEPAPARADLIEWLETSIDRSSRPVASSAPAARPESPAPPTRTSGARRGPRGAEDRLRRLLVMLPWLMERGEVSVAETAQRFDLTEAEIAKDLELVAMCGLPPFVDELVDVFIDEGMIWVGVPRLFTRPLRLNSVEAWELLAAGRAAMELPGADADGPLGRGLAKLASALGDDDTSGVRIELDRPVEADDLAAAAETGVQVRIHYWSPARDEVTERLIVPRQVFTDRGQWYVSADDDRSGEVRTFRIDRIATLEPTGERPGASDEPLPVPGSWFSDGAIPRVVVRVGPPARWLVERYPVDRVDGPDEGGWMTVTLPVVSEPWFARTMVRLGPDAEVVEPAEWAEVGRRAAARILDRYRS